MPYTETNDNTADTSNTQSQLEIWYWNESKVKTDTDPEEEEDYNAEETKHKAVQSGERQESDANRPTISSLAPKNLELKFNEEGER